MYVLRRIRTIYSYQQRRMSRSLLVRVPQCTSLVKGRKIALLGQLVLREICVFQVGKIMYMMTPESANQTFNPYTIGTECFSATKSLVRNYERFHDLHDDDIALYDEDGDMPEDGED